MLWYILKNILRHLQCRNEDMIYKQYTNNMHIVEFRQPFSGSYLLFLYLWVFRCVCAHTCVCRCTFGWKPEVSVMCWSLTGPYLPSNLTRMPGQQAPGSTHSWLCSTGILHVCHCLCPAFYMSAKDPTSMLAQKHFPDYFPSLCPYTHAHAHACAHARMSQSLFYHLNSELVSQEVKEKAITEQWPQRCFLRAFTPQSRLTGG